MLEKVVTVMLALFGIITVFPGEIVSVPIVQVVPAKMIADVPLANVTAL